MRVRRLQGASTSAVHGLYLSDGSRLVLRRYVWAGFLLAEPEAPEREVGALRFAASRGVNAPEVVAADVTGREVGDGVPTILMTLLPGRPVASPDPDRLAALLASVHDADPATFRHDYFPWFQDSLTRAPPESSRPALWETAIDLWRSAMPPYVPTFIHRDFHPGNVLWSRGRPSGVVDWVNACRGPRGCDLATCHANLSGLAGEEEADRFVGAYESLTGELLDPYWVMVNVLEGTDSGRSPARLGEEEPVLARAVQAVLERL